MKNNRFKYIVYRKIIFDVKKQIYELIKRITLELRSHINSKACEEIDVTIHHVKYLNQVIKTCEKFRSSNQNMLYTCMQ